jgi:molecular chaperone GrpE
MSKSNGKADVGLDDRIKDEQVKDQAKGDHVKDERMKRRQPGEEREAELPPADPADGFEERPAAAADAQRPGGSELERVQAERDNLFDRLARLQAEFDNYRKRAAKENADFRDFAVADAAKALLPVIDNFSLALKNASAKPEDLRKGVELIHKQLQDVLQKMNVQRVPAQGEPFDPRVHEAIEVVESNEVPDHHVLEELQPGYRIKERLLRPAMVRVAKKVG